MLFLVLLILFILMIAYASKLYKKNIYARLWRLFLKSGISVKLLILFLIGFQFLDTALVLAKTIESLYDSASFWGSGFPFLSFGYKVYSANTVVVLFVCILLILATIDFLEGGLLAGFLLLVYFGLNIPRFTNGVFSIRFGPSFISYVDLFEFFYRPSPSSGKYSVHLVFVFLFSLTLYYSYRVKNIRRAKNEEL